MPDPFGTKHLRESFGALEGAGRVLPLTLPRDQEDAHALPDPIEVITLHVLHVSHRVVEVEVVTRFPPSHVGRVVDAALADRDREEVGPLQTEVGRMVGAETAAGNDRFRETSAVVVHTGYDVVDDPVLVQTMTRCSFFDRDRV